jgi:O-antigen/teichoic acid export membrane protein
VGLQAQRYVTSVSVVSALAGALTVVGIVLFVPTYQTLGAAWVSFATYWLAGLLLALHLARRTPLGIREFVPRPTDAVTILRALRFRTRQDLA